MGGWGGWVEGLGKDMDMWMITNVFMCTYVVCDILLRVLVCLCVSSYTHTLIIHS